VAPAGRLPVRSKIASLRLSVIDIVTAFRMNVVISSDFDSAWLP